MKDLDIIRIENLNKSYGEVKAVNNFSFKVKKGELFAFLGENGAGKSTTISIICSQLKKDGGKVYIDGCDIDNNSEITKTKLGVVFQSSVLDKALTVRDNLQCRAALYGIKGKQFESKLSFLASILKFENLLNRQVGKLSGGQSRKIDIARALIHSPEILILDEPTTGLDPRTRKLLWQVIADFRIKNNLTVLLTTHYMEEAAESDYVVIIDGGKISAEGTPLQLKNTFTGDYIILYNTTEEKVKTLNYPYQKINDYYKICIPNTKVATDLIQKHSEIFVDFEITKGKMDDVFLAVTGKKLINGGGLNE